MSDEQNDKWKMFKNYLHNELKLSKSDIEMWVKEAVYEVAEKFVENNLSADDFHQHVKKCIGELVAEIGGQSPKSVVRVWGERNLKELISQEVMKHVEIKIGIKE